MSHSMGRYDILPAPGIVVSPHSMKITQLDCHHRIKSVIPWAAGVEFRVTSSTQLELKADGMS